MYYTFILPLIFFVELHGASAINSLAIGSKFNIAPLITVNDRHIKSFKIKYDRKKLTLFGLHHDYLGAYETQRFVSYHSIIQGPKGSFGANVVIGGVDYGFKTLFPPQWTYEKIVLLLIELCVRRYGNMTFEQYSQCTNREAFQDAIKGLLVRVIFDKRKYHVVSAYPVISRPNNPEF